MLQNFPSKVNKLEPLIHSLRKPSKAVWESFAKYFWDQKIVKSLSTQLINNHSNYSVFCSYSCIGSWTAENIKRSQFQFTGPDISSKKQAEKVWKTTAELILKYERKNAPVTERLAKPAKKVKVRKRYYQRDTGDQ